LVFWQIKKVGLLIHMLIATEIRASRTGRDGLGRRPGRSRRRIAAAVAILASALAAGCGESAPASAPGAAPPAGTPRRNIVTTTGMVTDIVRAVAGELADVTGLMGEGVDPHLYQATASDVRRLQSADVIFYSGLMLEGRMADTLLRSARGGRPVYAVTELIDESYLLAPPEFAGHWDPHVWMDVAAWSRCVSAVAGALAEVDPVHAGEYAARAERFRAELESLDAYVRTVIASVPERQRVLVTAHDAFNYFGRAYSIDVRGIQGISTASEAGVEDINRLVDFIVERGVRAVFVESSVSDKNVRALIEGARSRGHEVTIGGSLFSDAMGAPGTYRGTYVGMIDHNATTIARALGGDAPAGGFRGALAGPGAPAAGTGAP
jgi:manganese/zinc/iron transport system substrate-binding protein